MVKTRAKSLWTKNLRAGVRAFRSVASRDSPLVQSSDDARSIIVYPLARVCSTQVPAVMKMCAGPARKDERAGAFRSAQVFVPVNGRLPVMTLSYTVSRQRALVRRRMLAHGWCANVMSGGGHQGRSRRPLCVHSGSCARRAHAVLHVHVLRRSRAFLLSS